MWILVRVGISLVVFVLKLGRFLDRNLDEKDYQGKPYTEKKHYPKNSKKVSWHRISLPMKTGVSFKLTEEGFFDRAFKKLGLTSEFQTQDPSFDNFVFVACDHPFFGQMLGSSAELRNKLKNLLKTEIYLIWSEGDNLFFAQRSEINVPQALPQFLEIRDELQKLRQSLPSRWSDHFAFRVLAVEALVWTLATFAFGSLFDYLFHQYSYHLSTKPLVVYGLGLALIAFLSLMVLIGLFLRKSSRGHRILIESFLLLLFALPVSGIQTVSDINRSMDASSPAEVSMTIADAQVVKRRSRKGGTTYTYHLWAAGQIADSELPKLNRSLSVHIQVPIEIYNSVRVNQEVPFVIGQGYLDIPWYKSINGIPLGDPAAID